MLARTYSLALNRFSSLDFKKSFSGKLNTAIAVEVKDPDTHPDYHVVSFGSIGFIYSLAHGDPNTIKLFDNVLEYLLEGK